MASIDRQLGIPAKSVSDIAAKIKAEENKIAGLEEAVKKPWGKEDELNAAQAEVNDLQRQLVEKAKAEDIQLESTLDVDGTLVKEEGETRFRFMGVDTTNNQDNVSSIESSINDWSNKLNTPVIQLQGSSCRWLSTGRAHRSFLPECLGYQQRCKVIHPASGTTELRRTVI